MSSALLSVISRRPVVFKNLLREAIEITFDLVNENLLELPELLFFFGREWLSLFGRDEKNLPCDSVHCIS